MPEIHESTPRETYTIAGESFSIPAPYAAGHHLTEGEANALNQTWAENVRNNQASKVKEAKEAGTFIQDVFQGRIDDYCESYEFGVRSGGGGRTSDPVMGEALNIARDMVRKALVAKGFRLSGEGAVKAAKVSELAKRLIEKNPAILDTARARVEEVRQIADIALGDLDMGEEDKPAKGKSKAAA